MPVAEEFTERIVVTGRRLAMLFDKESAYCLSECSTVPSLLVTVRCCVHLV